MWTLMSASLSSLRCPRRTANSSSRQRKQGCELLTSLVLILACLGVDEELDEGVEGLDEQLVEDEADDDGLGSANGRFDGQAGVKAERGEERLVVDEHREEDEGPEKVALGDEQQAAGVPCG